MHTHLLLDQLQPLIILDSCIYHTYSLATMIIKNSRILEQILEFREDHLQHITDLLDILQKHGKHLSTPPLPAIPTLKNNYETVDIDNPLRTLHANERLAVTIYSKTSDLPTSRKLSRILEQNREDEEAHLQFFETILSIKNIAA